MTYTEKVIAGEAPPITHLEKVIAGIASPVTHLEQVWAGSPPTPSEHEYTGAVPISFTANGTPLLDYLISGNMVQTGTPTPDTPITPSECGERTGNLWDFGQWLTDRGATYTKDGDSYTFGSQQAMYSTPFYFSQTDIIISISGLIEAVTATNPRVHLLKADGTRAKTDALTTANSKYENVSCAGLIFGWSTPGNIKVSLPMLNSGSTALPYEPYGYKLPITSGGTTTPVYLGEVQSTRRIKKLVLTGNETWYVNVESGNQIYNLRDTIIPNQSPIICNAFESTTWGSMRTKDESISVAWTFAQRTINIRYDAVNLETLQDSLSNFKTYLQQQYAAGTPVTIWYVLATTTTGIVNEPLRKIGDYADTLSYEQAGVQIPTLHGNTVIDVLTELKPSEMYIKYQE